VAHPVAEEDTVVAQAVVEDTVAHQVVAAVTAAHLVAAVVMVAHPVAEVAMEVHLVGALKFIFSCLLLMIYLIKKPYYYKNQKPIVNFHHFKSFDNMFDKLMIS